MIFIDWWNMYNFRCCSHAKCNRMQIGTIYKAHILRRTMHFGNIISGHIRGVATNHIARALNREKLHEILWDDEICQHWKRFGMHIQAIWSCIIRWIWAWEFCVTDLHTREKYTARGRSIFVAVSDSQFWLVIDKDTHSAWIFEMVLEELFWHRSRWDWMRNVSRPMLASRQQTEKITAERRSSRQWNFQFPRVNRAHFLVRLTGRPHLMYAYILHTQTYRFAIFHASMAVDGVGCDASKMKLLSKIHVRPRASNNHRKIRASSANNKSPNTIPNYYTTALHKMKWK